MPGPALTTPAAQEAPPYPSALRLRGRRVLVAGAGHVAQRRLPALLAAGADVLVVSPEATPAVEGLASAGEIRWERRAVREEDLDEAWYAIAATDDPSANELVSKAAEDRRIFCVRSDDAREASAWTPAVGRHAGVTVAVVGNRQPRRSAALRDEIMAGLRDGLLRGDPTPMEPGVVLVGGGPGDPDLLTVAARRALADADVVVADRLAPREVLGELSPDVELVDVAKLPRGRAAAQEEINRVIVARAREGKRVVRFKGGDSFVFGRGFEEALACAEAGVPCHVIPGVTSAISVPALAGIPVTHRGVAHDVTVVSGHLPPGHADSLVSWESVAGLRGTVVLLMAVQNLAEIAAALVAGGRAADTPVAVVADGSLSTQEAVWTTLSAAARDVSRSGLRPPAVVVVGEVVAVANPAAYGGDGVAPVRARGGEGSDEEETAR